MEFDQEKYMDLSKEFPYMFEYENNPLPSDSTFRSDVILLNGKDIKVT